MAVHNERVVHVRQQSVVCHNLGQVRGTTASTGEVNVLVQNQ